MERLLCFIIGYLFGNFLTAEALSRRITGKSIFERGTGNPGMANVVALDGAKWGAVVLAGDLGKTFLPCLACRMLLFPELGAAAAAYAGLGAVLIPLAFLFPAFCVYGNETGVIVLVMAVVMFQRHLPGLRNIPSGTEPKKDPLKKLKDKIKSALADKR